MRIFGLSITRLADGWTIEKATDGLQSVHDRGSWWWPIIGEPFTGAWQRNQEWHVDTVLAFHAVFSCITLIASDIGKLRAKLVEKDANGIWSEVTRQSPFGPVLRKPNHYQNHIQFKEWWIISKLVRGNTYALKERDTRGVVRALYLLDPSRAKPLVAPDGSVFYELHPDNLSGQPETVTVPASEIIHDRFNCLFHPLVGLSPIFASGLAAHVGQKIENSSAHFFSRGANPSGILSAPAAIPQEVADRIKLHWQTEYSGDHAGAVAVLGSGLTFTPMRMTAVDAQTIEQLKWSAETVCSTFHVPPFKAGIGTLPAFANAAETLNRIYYSDCLQAHIESMELALDEGLGLTDPKEGKVLGVELDLEGLLRMDAGAQMDALVKGVGGAVLTPNEARATLDKPPLKGGETVYIQQQNYSIAALDERDKDKPFTKPTPGPTGAPGEPPPNGEEPDDEPDPDDEETEEQRNARLALEFRKAFRAPRRAA